MKYADKMFYRGFAVALAALARAGEPRHAAQLAQSNGIRLSELKAAGVDSYDLSELEPEMAKFEPVIRKLRKPAVLKRSHGKKK